MNRRALVCAAAAAIAGAALPGCGRPTAAPRRIGLLSAGARPPDALLQAGAGALRATGWVEGANLVVERRYASDRLELLPALAAELVRLEVELIVTTGSDATLAAKNATARVPIVMYSAGDPVRSGFVASLSRPGGNVTGFSRVGPELNTRRLTLIREVVPALQRVGMLENSTNPYYRAVRREFAQACESMDIQPIFIEVAEADELEPAIADFARQRADALFVEPDRLFNAHQASIMKAALRHALPTVAVYKGSLEDGALLAYWNNEEEMEQRNAAFVDRILRGAKPAELPIEQPTRFELGINLKTATSLGLAVPQSLLLQAVEVIR